MARKFQFDVDPKQTLLLARRRSAFLNWMKLDNVDVWAESHCNKALVYYEWDIGRKSRV